MNVQEAYEHINNAFKAGKLATGYLIVGNVRADALELTEKILGDLFSPDQVRARTHPDIHYLKPELKSRVISVDAMHEKMIGPMTLTAYQGGWKAGVIQWADCLNSVSANAFLKMLEEPPPKSVFFLLTDAPDSILPTIISRCQRIYLDSATHLRELPEPEQSEVIKALSANNLDTVAAKAALACRLAEILAQLKVKAESLVDEEIQNAGGASAEVSDKEYEALVSSRYREFRSDFARTLLSWFRDLAVVRAAGKTPVLVNENYASTLLARAENLTLADVFGNVEAVAELARAFERNLKEDTVLFAFTDMVKFGTGGK